MPEGAVETAFLDARSIDHSSRESIEQLAVDLAARRTVDDQPPFRTPSNERCRPTVHVRRLLSAVQPGRASLACAAFTATAKRTRLLGFESHRVRWSTVR